MRLVSLREYLDRSFEPGSRPTLKTGRRMIERGEIPASAARRIGQRWFVDLDVVEKDEIDDLVNGVLNHGQASR